jgi:N-acetylneuraminic acid mutarotase
MLWNRCWLRSIRRVAFLLALCGTIPLGAEEAKITELAPLKTPVTSFGAALAGGHLWIYGGHLGSPHEYAADWQSGQLARLDLARPAAWEIVGEGPRRTGLAMVGYQDRLYRVGGWEAKNAKGTEQDLHSTRDFARFDPKTGQWQELAPLPEGRSSHDAALVGSKLYVVGGWELSGKGSGDWHKTAYFCDLAQENPAWKPIAAPPFNRRALAVAGYAGKLYVIGGMDDSNDATTGTDIYDPASDAWFKGPALPGQPFDGFGTAAVGGSAGLFATTREGLLCRLADDGNSWQEIEKLKHPRSFHRLVADGEGRIIVVGGTSRAGKIAAVEVVQVAPTSAGR